MAPRERLTVSGEGSPELGDGPCSAAGPPAGRGAREACSGAAHWYRVGPAFHGARLDRFLQRMIPKLSRNRVQKAIETRVRLSWDSPVKPSTPVRMGGIVYADDPALEERETDAALPVLYEDRDVLAIDKPPGLVVHPTHGHNRNTVITLLRTRRGEAGLTLAHRIDAETSGVLLLGRHRWAARKLQTAFERGRVRKEYVALALGHPGESRFTIERPLGTHTRNGTIFRQSSLGSPVKPARSLVAVLRAVDRFSLVAVELVTGRRHQIRAHLAEEGHPVVGDKLYMLDDRDYASFLRTGELSAQARQTLGADRTLLHSRAIEIPHPRNPGGRIRIEAPIPDDMRRAIDGRTS